MTVTLQDVSIVGMGIVSPIGGDLDTFTDSLKGGYSGIDRLTDYQSLDDLAVTIGAEIKGFDFAQHLERLATSDQALAVSAKKLARRAPFSIQTSVASATQAWTQAGLHQNPIANERVGIVVAAQNTTQHYQYQLRHKFDDSPEYLSPRYALEYLETNQVGVLSELLNIQGEGFTIGGASASGNVAIIKAMQMIQMGLVDACLVVGAVADLSPMDVQGFINIGAMGGKTVTDPARACRPFDQGHEGFIWGQASACVMLESTQSAKARGQGILANLLSGVTYLAADSTSQPSVDAEVKVMLAAIENAVISPDDIGYINTHGTASPIGDQTEVAAILQAFSQHAENVWLNSSKSLTGHCLFSAGLVEAIATVQQMRKRFIHPNLNLDNPIDQTLRFAPKESVETGFNLALSNSFGFGGINSSIVFAAS